MFFLKDKKCSLIIKVSNAFVVVLNKYTLPVLRELNRISSADCDLTVCIKKINKKVLMVLFIFLCVNVHNGTRQIHIMLSANLSPEQLQLKDKMAP
jgi:hypothetical protein